MVVGEIHELDCRCSIEVVEIYVERWDALFVLHMGERALEKVFVSIGEWFSFDDEEIFHFEATLDYVFSDADAKIFQLTDYNCEIKEGSYGNYDLYR